MTSAERDAGDEQREPERRTLIDSKHWQCETCRGHRFLLIERGIERLSWCIGCYDEQGDKRAA